MLKAFKSLLVFVFLFALFPPEVSAQVPVRKSENKVIIEGKIYYIHIVKPGQTLFSITKAYEVEEKDIAIENPGVYSGLQVGQVLKIPVEVPKRDDDKPKTDTTRFISHQLKEGETVFSLSRKYNVPAEEIENANPDIDVTDLAIGQRILIPKLRTVWAEEDFYLHKVRRKETIFSLSRRYDVTEEDIQKYNPALQWGGLKTGQVIRIPKREFLARTEETYIPAEEIDSLAVEEDFQFDELFYADSLGLEEISIGDYARNLKDFNRRELNVAYLIPFNYRIEVDTIEVEKPDEVEEDEEEEKEEENLPRSINFLEFFEGSLLALDSLRKEGYSINVKYFDTHRSPTRVREILSNPFFRDIDLIIGPFYAYNVEIVSDFSRRNRLPLISPFYDGLDLTAQNPYLFQINPSFKTEYSAAARILSGKYHKNFIFIYRQDSMKYHEIDYFKSSLMDNLRDYIHTENVVIKEISYENAAKANLASDFSHALSRDKQNVVIIPERNEAFVSTVITQLYFQLRDFDIEVFGLPYFHEFENFDFQYYHALRLSYLSPFYYNYEDDQITNFLELFRQSFNAEPTLATRKGCSYAFVAFDISYFFMKQILEENRRFIARMNDHEIDNLLPDFKFERNSSYGGFENRALKYVKFSDDFAISAQDAEDVEIPRKPDFPRIFHLDWDKDEIK